MELAEVFRDIAINITNRTEFEVWVKIQQLKEFKVFNSLKLSIVVLLVIYCWDSLKS